MFESIGTLAYQGVSCFSHSKPNVATKIRLANPLVVCPAISASLTALLSVYHHCIGDHITPNVKAQKRAKNSHSKIAFFLPVGFKDCIMSQDNCFEKNCTGGKRAPHRCQRRFRRQTVHTTRQSGETTLSLKKGEVHAVCQVLGASHVTAEP